VKIFQSEQRSLFGEILDWMLTPLLLLWPISLVLTWLVAQSVAGKPFDRALEYNVTELATLVKVSDRQVQFSLPQPARQLLRADDSDTVFYQILGARGEYLAGERDLPLPDDVEAPFFGEVHIRDSEFHGDRCAGGLHLGAPRDSGARPALVQVAESLDKRAVLATEIVKGVMLPQFVILPLAVLLVWVGLAYAIKPLNRLEERIRARGPTI
jgi:two-component system sensor histidine kinase TctE